MLLCFLDCSINPLQNVPVTWSVHRLLHLEGKGLMLSFTEIVD